MSAIAKSTIAMLVLATVIAIIAIIYHEVKKQPGEMGPVGVIGLTGERGDRGLPGPPGVFLPTYLASRYGNNFLNTPNSVNWVAIASGEPSVILARNLADWKSLSGLSIQYTGSGTVTVRITFIFSTRTTGGSDTDLSTQFYWALSINNVVIPRTKVTLPSNASNHVYSMSLMTEISSSDLVSVLSSRYNAPTSNIQVNNMVSIVTEIA